MSVRSTPRAAAAGVALLALSMVATNPTTALGVGPAAPAVPVAAGVPLAPPVRLTTQSLEADATRAARDGALEAYFESLSASLGKELGSAAPKVVARFAATDAGALALMQWRVLARVGPAVRADAACRGLFAWMLADRDALGMFLGSGDPAGGKWEEAARVLARCVRDESHRAGLPLRIAVATALVFAEPVRWMADNTPIDPVARLDSYIAWDREGVLFASFRDLSAWELRYVVGSWSSDADLAWARANIKAELRARDKVGDGAHMLAYNLVNKNGVSVQEGGRFYDNKPMTLAVMLEYGGVCGAISRFGSSMSQAFGVPAMPVGQPGHCAFLWQKEPHRWSINNDISGWAESGCHAGIVMQWGHPAWFMPLMQEAQADARAFVAAETLLAAAELCKQDERGAIAAEACKLCPLHYGAWSMRIAAAKPAEARKLGKPLAEDFARHPVAFAQLFNQLPAAEGGEAKRARGAAATIASMANAGADAGLCSWAVQTVLDASVRRMVGGDSADAAAALVRGNAPGGARISDAKAREVVALAIECANQLDVAPEGPAHEAWKQAMNRLVRGVVFSPVAREDGLKDIQQGIGVLMRKNRANEARWIADRIVDAAKEAKDGPLETRAVELRNTLG